MAEKIFLGVAWPYEKGHTTTHHHTAPPPPPPPPSTPPPPHPRARAPQDLFLRLYEKGDIYTAVMRLPFCAVEKRFLLDRYVEGTCPICGYEAARGAQCDNSGNVLDPEDLRDPRCQFECSA